MINYNINNNILNISITDITLRQSADIIEHIEKIIGKPTLDDEVYKILKSEGKLHAVKFYKEKTGLGLKESKEYCDALELKRKSSN